MYTVASSAAPLKHAGKVDQAASKPGSQSSVFVFQGAQAAPTANGHTAAVRPAGMITVSHLIVVSKHYFAFIYNLSVLLSGKIFIHHERSRG